jgi:pyridoxine 4-dehydrogenase
VSGSHVAQFFFGSLPRLLIGDHVIPLPGSSESSRTLENFAAADVVFTPDEKKEIDEVVASFRVVGARYPEAYQSYLMK